MSTKRVCVVGFRAFWVRFRWNTITWILFLFFNFYSPIYFVSAAFCGVFQNTQGRNCLNKNICFMWLGFRHLKVIVNIRRAVSRLRDLQLKTILFSIEILLFRSENNAVFFKSYYNIKLIPIIWLIFSLQVKREFSELFF